jgi:calcium permeable stress-gated cation channel
MSLSLVRSSGNGTGLANAKTASTSSFVTSLIFNAAVFGGELAAFTLFRPYFHLIYEPRSYSPVSSKRVDPLTPASPIASFGDWRGNLNNWKASWLKWPIKLWQADYQRIKRVNGMDAYMFIRFLRMLVKLWLPIWVLSWAVLLPVTSVHTNVAGHEGLDIFIFGNVAPNKQARYWAHLVMAWAFTCTALHSWSLYGC